MKTSLVQKMLVILVFAVLVVAQIAYAQDEGEPLKVYGIYPTPLEEVWPQTIHNALVAAQEQGRIDYSFAEDVGYAGDMASTLREVIAEHQPDIIFGDSFGENELPVREVAAEFPEIAFVFGSGLRPSDPNFSVFDNWIHEPAYLSGLVAGSITESNTIGVVAGYPVPEVNRIVNAFINGIQEINPDAQVLVTFLNSWYDLNHAGEVAHAQIQAGADVIYAERAGVIEVAQAQDVLVIGSIVDQSSEAPNTVVTGPMWDLSPTVDLILGQVADGTYAAQDLKDYSMMWKGGARLAPFHGFEQTLDADLLTMVREREQAILDGLYRVDIDESTPVGAEMAQGDTTSDDDSLYVSIRRYENVAPDTLDEISRLSWERFVPLISEAPCYVGYYLFGNENGELVAISIFESEEQAAASNEIARDYVAENIAPLLPDSPEVTQGIITNRTEIGLNADLELPLFGNVRIYSGFDPADAEPLFRIVREDFIPVIEQAPGFVAYYTMQTDRDVVAAISIYETEEASINSIEFTRQYVAANTAPYLPEDPQITEGAVTVADFAEFPETVRMARATWETGYFQAEIFRMLLTELGYNVDMLGDMITDEFYPALAQDDDVDMWANGWLPSHNIFLEQEDVGDRVSVVGLEVESGALQGFMVDKATADALGITSLTDLQDPDIAAVFDRDGDGKADMVGCTVGWSCELDIERIISDNDLNDVLMPLKDDYEDMMLDTIARYEAGEPVLFFAWTPHWVISELTPGEDVVWITVPETEDAPAAEAIDGCVADPCSMGFPVNHIQAIANTAFLAEHPDVEALLEAITIPLEDITAQNLKMLQGENSDSDVHAHAEQWIADNREQVNEWLASATGLE